MRRKDEDSAGHEIMEAALGDGRGDRRPVLRHAGDSRRVGHTHRLTLRAALLASALTFALLVPSALAAERPSDAGTIDRATCRAIIAELRSTPTAIAVGQRERIATLRDTECRLVVNADSSWTWPRALNLLRLSPFDSFPPREGGPAVIT